jgi:hypothetical protein
MVTVAEIVEFTKQQYGRHPMPPRISTLPHGASRLQTAKEICREAGFVVIETARIRQLQATVSIADEIKYLKVPEFDYMKYAKTDIARLMAFELDPAIVWTVSVDKYLPCTRVRGRVHVVMPK